MKEVNLTTFVPPSRDCYILIQSPAIQPNPMLGFVNVRLFLVQSGRKPEANRVAELSAEALAGGWTIARPRLGGL